MMLKSRFLPDLVSPGLASSVGKVSQHTSFLGTSLCRLKIGEHNDNLCKGQIMIMKQLHLACRMKVVTGIGVVPNVFERRVRLLVAKATHLPRTT